MCALRTTTIFYRRPETIAAVADFRKRFTQRRDWQAKWSDRFIADAEADLLSEAMSADSKESITAAVQRVADLLDEDPSEYVVIMPIGGLFLGDVVLTFAGIEISTMSEARLSKLRQQYYAIIETTQNSDEDKTAFRRRVDERNALLLNRVCAFVTVASDPQMCQDLAEAQLEPIVDFFQLMTAIFEHNFKNIHVSLDGDLLTRQPPSLVVKSDGTHILDNQKLAYDHRLNVDPTKLEQMRKDFGPLFRILEKRERDRTEFESVILRSMHWIADADRQRLPENKTTSYITAIEMFFSASDAPITRDVSEGVSTIMGSTLEERREICTEVTTLYGSRSRISHRGERLAKGADAITLKTIAVNLLSKLGNMSSSFDSLPALRSWLADQRLKP